MENKTILLDGFLNEAGRVVADHFIVGVIAAIIVLLIAFFRERLLNLSTMFAPIKVHGKWSHTLGEQTAGTPSGTARQATPQIEKPHEYVKLHQFFNRS